MGKRILRAAGVREVWGKSQGFSCDNKSGGRKRYREEKSGKPEKTATKNILKGLAMVFPAAVQHHNLYVKEFNNAI